MSRILVSLLALVAAALPMAASAQYRQYDDSRYGSAGVVRCESNDERTRRCDVDTRGGVRLIRQESRSSCVEGRTWGYDRRGIWVSRGCRAQFEVGGGYGGGYDRGRGRDYDRDYDRGYERGGQVIRCESRDGRPRFCRVPGGVRQAEIVRRLSDSRCDYNYNWGFRRDGIWVERGCRAEFRVY